MTKPWLNLSIVVGLVFLLATPAWPDFQAAVDAAKRGDYDTAVKELRPLAEQGHPKAQYNLGVMYERGHGIESAIKAQEIMMKEMTPAQIMEAERLAREWKAKGK